MSTEILPLSVVKKPSKVFVNKSKKAVDLRIWAIAEGDGGAIGVGILNSSSSPRTGGGAELPDYDSLLRERISLDPAGELVVLQLSIGDKETLHVAPATDGSVSIRVETVT